MKKNIDLEILIKYKEGQLSEEDNQKVETFLAENPHYLLMFEGLDKMKQQTNEAPLVHLKKRKQLLKDKIFKK